MRPPIKMRLLAVAGLAFGASALFSGFFELSTWGPMALLALALLLGLLLAESPSPPPLGVVAILGLGLLWIVSLLSIGWSESADQALTEANRWMLYATLLTIFLLLIEATRGASAAVLTAAAAILAVAAYVVVRMLIGDGSPLFFEQRLHEPLGYINGQGSYFLLGFWPLLVIGERSPSRLLAGLAIGACVVLAGLVLLTQSRGALLAFAVSATLLLVVVPGRRRRTWALVAVLAGTLVAAGPILEVSEELPSDETALGDAVVFSAAAFLLLGAVLAGAAWAWATGLSERWMERSESVRARLERASATGLTLIALAGVAIAIVAVGNPITKASDELDAFTSLESDEEGSASRLTSGGGNRYDYWRIAAGQFADNPIRGIGAGNYDRTYYLERRTDETITQPHSIELQTLAELGLVGAIAVVLIIGSALVAFWRRARPRSGGIAFDPALAVAAGGTFLVWLVQTSVDWIHLFPGLTGIALISVAALVSSSDADEPIRAAPARRAVLALSLLVICAAAISVARPTIAERLRSDGASKLESDPAAAIDKASDSRALNDEALPTYYLEAAAYARLDMYEKARGALLEATRREPHDHVSWALLGDLAVRRGDVEAAIAAYDRASELNPRDEYLASLARDGEALRELLPESVRRRLEAQDRRKAREAREKRREARRRAAGDRQRAERVRERRDRRG